MAGAALFHKPSLLLLFQVLGFTGFSAVAATAAASSSPQYFTWSSSSLSSLFPVSAFVSSGSPRNNRSHRHIHRHKRAPLTAASSTTQTEEEQAGVMTTSTSTKSSSRSDAVRSVSPYTPDEQWEALNSLLEGSNDPKFDTRHMIGYFDPNNKQQHDLSMLQIITATRLLDLRKQRQEQQQQQSSSSSNGAPSLADLEVQAAAFRAEHGPPLNLQTVIQRQSLERNTMALAAEFKRASPSKGILAQGDISAAEQTSIYARAGADIISVLTEPRWFLGGFDDLTATRLATAATTTTTTTTTVQQSNDQEQQRPAILCKEFIVEEYVIAQAAASGADTCLLIVAVTPQHLLTRLINYARSLDMEPLVEVHALEELDVALQAGAKVIGVNNRNLHTFQMDLATSERVASEMTRRQLDITREYSLCALSGMSSAADVHRYRQAGLQMCLIGESLMRSSNPAQAIAGLCLNADDYHEAHQNNDAAILGEGVAGGAYTTGTQLVKVCGITRPEDALVACQAGANLIGVIFAERSKRKVTPEQAKAVVDAVRQFGERQTRHDFTATSIGDDAASSSSPLLHFIQQARSLAQAGTTRRPLVVGVFQNQDSAFVAQMVQECGLDLVQLHGKEGFAAANPSRCGGVPAIRVVDILVDPETGKATDNAGETILQQLTMDPIAILLDTAIQGKHGGGGTSVTFDWSIAQAVQNAGLPVLVAGGLTHENIADCVTSTRPFGVDVSSGVEEDNSPGVKNQDRVRAFVQAARHAATLANQGF